MNIMNVGKHYEFIDDGFGGMIVPDEIVNAIQQSQQFTTIDGVQYPYIHILGDNYVIVKTTKGWTISGDLVRAQHAKNVAQLAGV